MAEESSARHAPGKVFAEVSKDRHASYGIWHEIKEMEAKGEHDVVKEIRERGAEPARKVIDKEGVPIGASLGEIGRDDVRG